MNTETTATPQQIIDAVCTEFHVTKADLKGPRRPERLAYPRMLAMALGMELLHASPEEVTAWFNRERTGAYHADLAIKARIQTDPHFAAHVCNVRIKLLSLMLEAA